MTAPLTEAILPHIISQSNVYGITEIEVTPEQLVPVVIALKSQSEVSFSFMTDLCGIHYVEPTPRIGIVIHLHSMATNTRLRIKCFAESVERPTLPTLTGVFSAANWMERETYDFFGIHFDGHPNLIRILNEDTMTTFPMRKEFPLEDDTREDKDDTMFGR